MSISAGPHFPVTPRRRRTRNRPSSGHGKYRGVFGRVTGFSTTPLSHWKLNDGDEHPPAGKARRGRGDFGTASSRKLAASLWQLWLADGGERGGGGGGSLRGARDRSGTRVKFPSHCTGKDDRLINPFASPSKNGIPHKVRHSFPHPRCGMEGATMWDLRCSKTSDEAYRYNGHGKLLGDQKITTASALQAQLFQARLRIHELETERRSSNKKVEHLLRKLGEERSLWRRREREKIRVVIGDLKDELTSERGNRQKIENLNSRLVSELANAKVCAKKLMQDYEEEKKARELMEEISNELAKEIGEDRAEMAAWKSETLKFQEELEEERKMLQMAEVWREERVQMKLVDAKLALEEKYCHMNKLVKDLETFLQTRSEALGARELRKAELMRQAARSVNFGDVNEFSYVPSKSDDLFSIIEELRQGEAIKRGVNQHVDCRLESDEVEKKHVQNNSTIYNAHNIDLYEVSGQETVTCIEGLGSHISFDENERSINSTFRSRNGFRSTTAQNGQMGQYSPETGISEICSISAEQPKQYANPPSKHRKPYSSNGEIYKTIPDEFNGKLSNGATSSVEIAIPNERSSEDEPRHQHSEGQRGLPESGITQKMKEGIEWPQGISKNSLKARLLEARMESEKYQSHCVS